MARALPFGDSTLRSDHPHDSTRVAASTSAQQFRIVIVCTGNVARSPLIERLLRSELTGEAGERILVSSAGTQALTGRSMTEESRLIATFHGADPDGFAARQLDTAILSGADLIIAASREHMDAVLELRPGALLKTFTLRELARIVELQRSAASLSGPGGDVVETSREFVRRASQYRSGAHTADPVDDDVLDPYRRGAASYATMAEQVVPAVRAIAEALAGGR